MSDVSPDPASYDWVEELDLIAVAGCVTVSTTATRDELVAAFGTDVSASVGDDHDGDSTVSFVEVDGNHVAVEDNGGTGLREEVLAVLSGGGRAAVAFWNVDSMVLFGCAEDGRTRYVDEFAYAGLDGLPEALLPLARIAFDDVEKAGGEVSYPGVAMAMLEAWTGVRITPEHVTAALRTRYGNPL